MRRANAPRCGGYLLGPPELIVEVAASSVTIDLHGELRAYRRAGVREYLVWRSLDRQFDWFVLDQDEYRSNTPDSQSVLRSPHFPGLVLAVDALLEDDSAKVLDSSPNQPAKPRPRRLRCAAGRWACAARRASALLK